jgi:two-component system nitrogen regulation response regulator NtrX
MNPRLQADILIVDDKLDICDLISGILEDEGYKTRRAHDVESALQEIRFCAPHLVLLDVWLAHNPEGGFHILDALKIEHPHLPVIMISGHGTIESAVMAIQRGAYDFIEKPFTASRLLLATARALEAASLRQTVVALQEQIPYHRSFLGTSSAVNRLRYALERAASSNARVLITGPLGAGKNLAARTLHGLSRRVQGPFITFSPKILPESDHLAHMDGQNIPEKGILERAHGGTLYIDSVDALEISAQDRLLAFLQSVGQPWDVRIIASTSTVLAEKIVTGAFREDLFHRLNVLPIAVPSLMERREDIPELIMHHMTYLEHTVGLQKVFFTQEAIEVLQMCRWSGNVRQLNNCVERIMIEAGERQQKTIGPDQLPPDLTDILKVFPSDSDASVLDLSFREARERFEREYLRAQVHRFNGNVSRTANFVGMERSALHRKLKLVGAL